MRWLCALAIAGCGFRVHATNGGGGDDGGVTPDGGVESAMLVFDTQADFTRPGAAFDQLGTEPWGSLTSAAYVTGATVAHGVNTQLWDPGMTDAQLGFAIAANTPPDGAGVWRLDDLDDGAQLGQLGITALGGWSAWFEGELFLAAGDHQLALDADDVAFLELADATGFHQVATARWSTPVTPRTFHAAQTGWYPFRIGWSQTLGPSHLHLRHGVGTGPLLPIARAELRGRGDPLRGLMRDVLDHQMLAGGSEAIGIESSPFMATSGLRPPGAGIGEWSARWTGEVYITTPGDYTLSVTSDDGNHVTLDTASQSASFARGEGNASAHTDTTATLAAGWQPIVVDYNQVGGGSALDVRWTAAPDPALVGKPLAIARLRPVETRRGRIVPGAQVGANALVRDNQAAGALTAHAFPCFTGEVAGIVDVTARLLTPHADDLNIELVRPDGTALALCTRPSCAMPGGWFQTSVTDAAFLAPPASGTWKLHVFDDRGGLGHTGDTLLSDVYLTLRTTSGAPTVAEHGVWTSQIVTLDHPLADITAVTWIARTPRTADDVAVRLRACATADCAGEPWSDPIANGAAPAVIPGRGYVQLQVALDSDGDRETELEQLAVAYRQQ